jgi:hypothetical protein
MGTATGADDLRVLGVAALVVEVRPGEASHRVSCLAAVLGNASVPHPLLGLAQLAEASRPLPGRFTEQQLVDFLKMPTCGQPARKVIVDQLGQQCGRPFGNVWEFAAWAREHRPDLDLTSPPVRPTKP